MAKKAIVVTGDLLTDYHLVRRPALPSGYSTPVEETLHYEELGGAWFLHKMVTCSLGDLSNRKYTLSGPEKRDLQKGVSIGNAHSVWNAFPQRMGDKEQVWRIADFLGCGASASLSDSSRLSLTESKTNTEIPPASSVLVIDDIGLGFHAHENHWPDSIRPITAVSATGPGDVVLKTNSFSKDNLLLKHLLENYADNLTLVIAASDLRARGAVISKGLSWDRTIEETVCEFTTGLSSCDLARARRVIVHFDGGTGAASFTRLRLNLGPPTPESTLADLSSPIRDRACFERFLYLPNEVEGVWLEERPGKMFGRSSIMTASVVRHLVEPASYPLFMALGRGLAASRYNSERGGGSISSNAPSVDVAGIECRLDWSPKPKADNAQMTRKQWEQQAKKEANWPKEDPCFDYYTAFPHEVLTDPKWCQQPARESNLLRDAVGDDLEFYAAVAMDVVIRGPELGLLRSVPKARYGKYLTVDRQEIERINSLRNLIENYRSSNHDKRPLSIAVFGPPGSGKSFAIKQLAQTMFSQGQTSLEFNLSQFADGGTAQLHEAFHRVRDASIKGEIPLVFWDEFDSENLIWLKQFLAPMQDAEFQSGSGVHPFGKAIFVFAGGTCSTFETFDRSDSTDETERQFFRDRKGTDFVSRLRGFVNIKGPNPHDLECPKSDPEFLIRRAIILRSLLERSYGNLFRTEAKIANISTRVIRAFLQVTQFLHGARSMESVLSMSNLREATSFDVSELTTPELLGLHVTKDFVTLANRPEIQTEIIEALSEAFHKGWSILKRADGWKHGAVRDDNEKLHPLLVDFGKLPEEHQRGNYDPAIVTPPKLARLGYRIRRRRATLSKAPATAPWTGTELTELQEIEHDIWIRARMLQGYEYAEITNDSLRLHRDVAVFADVPVEDQKLDAANIDEITPTLHEYGYELVRDQESIADGDLLGGLGKNPRELA